MSKKNKSIFRKLATISLALMISFSGLASNSTFAEEVTTTPEDEVAEVQRKDSNEMEGPIESSDPIITPDSENPTQDSEEGDEPEATPEVTPEITPEVTPDSTPDTTPDINVDDGEKPSETETPDVDKDKEEKPSETATPEKESDKEEPKDDVVEEEVIEEEIVDDEEVNVKRELKIYYATDIVDYISAIAVLSDDPSVKLTVNSYQDATNIINYGVGVYFDGMYTLEFKDTETRDKAYGELAVLLGGNTILKDVSMGIHWVHNEGVTEVDEPVEPTEDAQVTPNEVKKQSEVTATPTASEEPKDTETPKTVEEPTKSEEAPVQEPEENVNPDLNVAKDTQNTMAMADAGNNNPAVKVVALIDSGVNGDLADARVNLTNDSDDDVIGHGTKMASIIKGYGGPASILSIKAFNDSGKGSIATVTAAVKLATEMNVDYINISASILDSKNTIAFNEAVNEALAKGIVVVASAGNNGTNASYFTPANIPGVDTVGSCLPGDGITSFKVSATSNFGEAVNWYYITDSTSEAAAHETGVLVAGKEAGGQVNGGWYRIPRVLSDKNSELYNDTYVMDHFGFADYAGNGEIFTLDGYRPFTTFNCVNNEGGTCVIYGEYYFDDTTGQVDWPSTLMWYFHTVDEYYPGAVGIPIFCTEPDVYTYPDQDSYNCTFTPSGSGGTAKDGVQVQHYISFDGQKVEAYDPATHNSEATAYTWTDTNGTLAEGEYRNSISVGEGDASKVHYSVSGNTLKVWFDADPNADMPDDITITIDGGKYKAATKGWCEGQPGGDVYCSSPGQDKAGSGGGAAVCHDGEDGYTYNPAKVNLKIIRGKIILQKVDAERDYAKAQGDATLAGAEVTVTNPSGRTYTGTTDENGAVTVSRIKWGDWTATETGASLGYLLNEDWTIDFQIRTANEELDFTDSDHQIKEQVIRGDVRLYKQDLEMSKVNGANPSQAIGGKAHRASTSSLNGITFEVKNVSKLSILSDANELLEYEPGELVVELLTEWDEEVGSYVAQTTGKALPYGTYTIQEVKTNNAYLLSDGTVHTFEIREEGSIVDANKNNATMIVKNQIKRGEFGFIKMTSGNEPMQTLWVLENSTSGEKHVIVTDVNGEYISNDLPHSQDTNANDFLLEEIEANGYDSKINLMQLIAEGKIKEYHGLWFGMGEEGDVANVDDSLMSLPYGQYVLHEVRTETNTGKDLQERSFNIARNNHQLATFTMIDEGITIKTTAREKETGLQNTMPSENTTLVDKVEIKDVADYGDYTLKTYLVYRDSSEPVLDAEGNPVEIEQVVTLNKLRQTVEVEVTFDSTNLGGRSVIFFEELYNGDGELVAEHKNPLDPDQTIVFPGIRTSLKDNLAGKPTTSVEVVTLIDTVKYEGLTVGKTYTMIGELHQRSEEGEDLGPLEGVEPVSVDFKARTSDGEVKVEFNVPSELLKGKTVVAFEECYNGETLVAIHADINDEGQTIIFTDPEIRTTAVNRQGRHLLFDSPNFEITDTVTYKGLRVGLEYELRCTIHQRNEAGEDAGAYTLPSGEVYEISHKFTPETSDGTEDINFVIDTSRLTQDTIVVFEDLYVNGELITQHRDINDKDQTLSRSIEPEGYEIYVAKVDQNNKPVIGATLELWELDPATDEYIHLYSWITTENKLKLTNNPDVSINVGKIYKIVESVVPAGYIKAKDYIFEVPEESNEDILIQMIDPEIKLSFLKTDPISGQPVKGAKYAIFALNPDINPTSIKGKTVKDLETSGYIEVITELVTTDSKDGQDTDIHGKKIATLLDPDTTYYLQEVEPPFGYYIDPDAHPFKIDITGNGKQTIKVQDSPKPLYVRIAKADADKVSYYLKGAEITIFKEDGTIAKTKDGKNAVGITDENGIATFILNFDQNTKYFAQETKAPAGYSINPNKFEVIVNDKYTFFETDLIKINILDKIIFIPPIKTGTGTLAVTSFATLLTAGFTLILLNKKKKGVLKK